MFLFFIRRRTGDELFRAYVVDDEPNVLENLTGNPLFIDCGYKIAGSSTDPIEAMNEIKRIIPDVVFTDLKMPGLSGVELMEQLRERGAECEFVIISAHGDFEASRRFFKMKGFDYLTKPVSDEELQSLLGRLSGRIAGKKASLSTHGGTSSPELNRIIAFLEKSLEEKHTLESLSEKFDINATYICHLFSVNLGTTFVSYMTKLRMETAADLLKGTRKSVKEIAGICGYDYLYFVQVFKKYHACTPTAFREGRGE